MWSTLTLRTRTPVFNSDGSTQRAQIRVPSLRGGMHFWLRTMAGAIVGPDLTALRSLENRILGSTDKASPIRLRISNQPAEGDTLSPEFLSWWDPSFTHADDGPPGQWIAYLLGPGITTRLPKGKVQLSRAFVPAGREFELKVRLVGTSKNDRRAHRCALAALWLSLAYGGVGARTRRGFGTVHILGAAGPVTELGLPSLATPGPEHFTGQTTLWPTGPAAAVMDDLLSLAKEFAGWKSLESRSWDGPPSYPVLSRDATVAGVHGGPWTSWEAALTSAGRELRFFRAQRNGDSKKSYRPRIKTSGWKDVVHGTGDALPLAAMGLPLVYDRDYEVHASSGGGKEKLRRASPLWIRPVTDGREWRLLSFGFLGRFLPPQDVSVDLWHRRRHSKKVQVTDADAHEHVRRWITTLSGNGTFLRQT